jgi:hypothetical protein
MASDRHPLAIDIGWVQMDLLFRCSQPDLVPALRAQKKRALQDADGSF